MENTNIYKVEDLSKIINIKQTINVKENEKFDYLRIASIKNEDEIKDNAKNILFFPIVLDKKDIKEGWIEKKIDLQTPIDEIVNKFPNYTFIIEESMIKRITNRKAKLIVVDNIMKSIDLLYKNAIQKSKAKVVAVTGSAGKTTTVGIIEQVLRKKLKVLRIYSDRITPIILKSHIINFIDETYDVIALEMGIYYFDHVKKLSKILKPDIAIIINIGTAHLGNKGLETLDKICENKAYILKNAEVGFLNGEDTHLSLIECKDGEIKYGNKTLFKTKIKELIKLRINNLKINKNRIYIDNNPINVPVLTKLSVLQYLIAYNIGLYFKIDKKEIIKALNEIKPVENRLERVQIFGKEVIFDGDSSFKERIHQISNHLYKKAYLVIRKYGADYYRDDFDGIGKYFEKFRKVFLFSDISYLDKLKEYPNVVVVSNHNFIKKLNGEIFYHYHDYYYTFDRLNEENLRGKE